MIKIQQQWILVLIVILIIVFIDVTVNMDRMDCWRRGISGWIHQTSTFRCKKTLKQTYLSENKYNNVFTTKSSFFSDLNVFNQFVLRRQEHLTNHTNALTHTKSLEIFRLDESTIITAEIFRRVQICGGQKNVLSP